ncbi:MAG: hypothetical protein AB1Z23_10000 [Eubacteriales bacterium]
MKEGYSIELLFDKNFESYVHDLWLSCAENNLSNYMTSIEGDSVPHIALSVYESVDKQEIQSLFDRYKNVDIIKAEFQSSAICMFKATNVIYINVNVNRDMLNYFEDVYHFFVGISDKCSPYYLPYVIIPHISIAKCNDFEKAKKCWMHIANIFQPQKFWVEKIALFKLYFDDNNQLTKCKKVDEIMLDSPK